MTTTQDAAGERFGPYELVSLLGRGGMGEVYRAYDTGRKRTVALKRLPLHLAGDPQYQIRFRREAEIAARLTEPHIIPIHDYGEIDGQLYIDMRLVAGADLAAVLEKTGPLPASRAVDIVGQVASALAAAHAEGLVHRDVKPSNMLISVTDRGEDFVHLVDFGIARDENLAALTSTGATVGTIDYMAPERLEGGQGDYRGDIYALGCVLYEALTATKPFPVTGAAAKMFAHIYTAPPRPSQRRPEIPPGLDEVVAIAMAKDPRARYPSVTELAASAHRSLDGARRATAQHRPAPTQTRGQGGQGGQDGFSPTLAQTGFGAARPPTATPGRPAPTRAMSAGEPTMIAPGGGQGPPQNRGPQLPPPDGRPSPPAARRRRGPLLIAAGAVVVVAGVAVAVLVSNTATSSPSTSPTGVPSTAGVSITAAPLPSTGAPAVLGGQAATGSPSQPASRPGQNPDPVAVGPAATTTITDANALVTRVRTTTLQVCGAGGIELSTGQQLTITQISRIDVTNVGSTALDVTITLLNGQKVIGQTSGSCVVSGTNNIGGYTMPLGKLQSVAIGR